MIKKILIIFVLSIFLLPGYTGAEEKVAGQEIKEIIITGNTRTDDEIIRQQLPFAKGDLWQESYGPWAIRRLRELDIFAHEPLRVLAEPLESDGCRVVVRVADPFFVYKDPIEFAFTTTMGLLFRQLSLNLYNPLGSGQNLYLNANWSPNYNYGAGLSSPLGAGTISLQGSYYRSDRTFTNTAYTSSGFRGNLSYAYWWNEDLRQSLSLGYYSTELAGQEQNIINPGLSLDYRGSLNGSLSLDLGFPLGDKMFWRARGLVSKSFRDFITVGRVGFSSAPTPENFQFGAGSFSSLPLRGESNMTLAQAYVLGTGEYHVHLWDMVVPVFFLDGGWLWEKGAAARGIVNLGGGAAIYTPLGVPVRFDAAINPITLDWNWNIGFGHTY